VLHRDTRLHSPLRRNILARFFASFLNFTDQFCRLHRQNAEVW
jgi:hypothetical protein